MCRSSHGNGTGSSNSSSSIDYYHSSHIATLHALTATCASPTRRAPRSSSPENKSISSPSLTAACKRGCNKGLTAFKFILISLLPFVWSPHFVRSASTSAGKNFEGAVAAQQVNSVGVQVDDFYFVGGSEGDGLASSTEGSLQNRPELDFIGEGEESRFG